MDAKYKVGEMVIINLDNEIIDAEVFGIVNSTTGKPSYSLRVKGNFIFMNEDRIISVSHE
jgi:hypothetical protein